MGSAAAEDPSAIIDMVQEWKGMGDGIVKSLKDCFSGIESREKNLRLASESLVERSRDLEKRERELEESESLLERRSEELSFREEKLDEQLRLVREHIEGLEASQGEVERLRKEEREKLVEIEKKEKELDVFRGLQERELDEVERLRREEHEKLKEIEKNERELYDLRGLQERELYEAERLRREECDKLKEIEKKEMEIEKKERELDVFRGLQKRELDEIERLGCEEREKLKEIEKKERELDVVRGLQERELNEVERLRREEHEKLKKIEKKERELDVVRGLQERELDEVGKKLKAFNAFQNGKLEELSSKGERFCKAKREFAEEVQLANEKIKEKEELLCKAKREFVEEVQLANEKLKEKQKMGYGLINRLESTLDMLGGMKVIIDDKLKEIDSRELMAYESLISRLNEADSIQESLDKRFKELEDIEKELNFSQDKTRNLVSKEQLLDTTKMVDTVKYEKHDCREQNVSSEREYLAKESPSLSKKDQPQAQLVETRIEVVLGEGQQARWPKEVKLERKLHDVYYEEQGSKQSMLTDTTAGGSADLGHKFQADRKTLESLINDHEKDLELMDTEIYKILLQSSDPANLVLCTVRGFYTLRSWKATILVLEQLIKMSPNIQHCVTFAAVEFAFEWKSKLSACVEDPMETLGFLHFVAAFQISSRFDKNELFNCLKLVGQHKQTPELCITLGLTFKIPGYIRYLINRKEYLLASTYAHEYRFLDINLKQAAILACYITNSKKSAIARARKEGNTFEARDKAIAGEITDLLAALAHINKYGLEGYYSPNVLAARIQQLEANRTRLRHGFPSSSAPADIQKQGTQKKKCKAQRKRHQTSPTGLPYTCAPSTPCPDGSYKRHKPNSWSKNGHLRFGNQH